MQLTGDQVRCLAGNTIFSVRFTKKDGTVRDMCCRLGVKKYLRGGQQPYNPAERGLLTVYDMAKKGYRNVNLNTLQSAKIRGVKY